MKVTISCSGADTIDIDMLEPFQGNLKSLSDENYKKLKKEIIELGFSEPISIWISGHNNYILNGHQRVRTLQKMRTEGIEVPRIPINFVQARNIKEAKKKVLALTSQYGTMERQGLYEFMHESGLDTEDLYDFRFPEIEIDTFMDEYYRETIDTERDKTKQDNVPETDDMDVYVKTGDLFEINGHRILCGDSLNPEQVARLFHGDHRVDMLLTDPPYGIDVAAKNKHLNRNDGGSRIEESILNDAIESYTEFYTKFLNPIPFADYNTCYCFLASGQLHELRQVLNSGKFHWSEYLIWLKNNHVLGMKDYNLKHEFIAYFWHCRHKFYGPHRTTILEYARPQTNKEHPTQKPIDLLEQLITDGSTNNALIYDPFLGSASTIIAAENVTNRKVFSIELSPKYVQISLERIKNYTSKTPVLLP